MPPKEKLPLSKGDDLAEVDDELESAMSRLDETTERIDRTIMNLEEGPESDEDLRADDDKGPETGHVEGGAES